MGKLDKKDIVDILSLTPMQQGMLFFYLQDPASDLYFEQLCLRISGPLRPEIFSKAWDLVIAGNEMLRTVFRWQKMKEPVQMILKKHQLQIRLFDLSAEKQAVYVSPGRRGKRKNSLTAEIRIKDRQEKFDLRQIPLRVSVIKLEKDKYEVIISNHHILYDGWSTGIILRELFAAYNALCAAEEWVKPEKNRFSEYVGWIRSRDQSRQEKFWRNYLSGFETPTSLPLKRARKQAAAAAGSIKDVLREDIRIKLERVVKDANVTLSALFYSAYGILLQKYNNTEDEVFGTTTAGRSAKIKGIEDMVGLFINTLPLRVQRSFAEKVIDLLHKINEAVQEREKYEATPLVQIREYSPMASSEELFDSIMVIENYPLPTELSSSKDRLVIEGYSMFEMTNYDLTIAITLSGDIRLNFIYNSRLLEESAIEGLSRHFINILEDMSENPLKRLSAVEMLSPREKERLLYEFNYREDDFPTSADIPRLFAAQVTKVPDNIALIGAGAKYLGLEKDWHASPMQSVQLTYRKLDEESGWLAQDLFVRGVRGNPLIGIMVDRTIEMITGILGILKSGSGYVPLNPGAPADRNEYMLRECAVELLLTSRSLKKEVEKFRSLEVEKVFIEEGRGEAFPFFSRSECFAPTCVRPSGKTVLPDEIEPGVGVRRAVPSEPATCNLQPVTSPLDLAYVIFTSGSTGKPKGVPISHANFCALMYWGYHHMKLDTRDKVVQNLSYYFDWSVWEIFVTLTSGAALYMVKEEIMLVPENYIDFMNRNGITVLHITPTQFQILTHTGEELKSLKHLAIGAEKLTLDLVLRAFALVNKECRVYNMYGPTEATIMAAVLDIDREKEAFYGNLSSIPIGPPIANTDFFILDRDLNPAPLYIAGELYIGGDGISSGYLNNPELTAEKFVRTVISHSSLVISHSSLVISSSKLSTNDQCPMTNDLLYKTGDLACWLPDGTVEFVGRIDQQVKIRGFRIEPGEIENRLLAHEKVKEAVVITRQYENGEYYLCAYIVEVSLPDSPHGMEAGLSPLELREYLSSALPDYMIPSYFVKIEQLPLNPNGKVNIEALPEPGISSKAREYAPPADKLEEELVNIWCDVLSLPGAAGMDDHFFESGGHSLKASRLLALIHKKFEVEIPLKEMFENPTIRALSRFIRQKQAVQYTGIEPLPLKEYYPLSSAQERLFILQRMEPESPAYNITGIMLVEGEIEKEKCEQVFIKLIRRHEALRTSIKVIDERPVQVIHSPGDIDFRIDYFETFTNLEAGEFISRFVRPFDLSEAPLLRAGILKISSRSGSSKITTPASHYILMLDIHHIIADGTSIDILTREFMILYSGGELPSLPLQYRDFVLWQKSDRQIEALKEQELFWLDKFTGELPLLNLPTDFPRPAVRDFKGGSLIFAIGREKTRALKELSAEEGVTQFMLLLSLFNVFLAKLSGQEDILVGTPAAGRRHVDLQDIVGMFVNTLVLRNCPAGHKTFRQFLNEVKTGTLVAFENQDYPFGDLVSKVVTKRDTARNPLFDVMFSLQNDTVPTAGSFPLKMKPVDYESGIAKFDLALDISERGDSLVCKTDYSTALFSKRTIKRFSRYFLEIVSSVTAHPGRYLRQIELIPEEEKKRILYDFNDTKVDYPRDRTIHRLFAEQAERSQERIAVVGLEKNVGAKHSVSGHNGNASPKQSVHLTYGESDKRANQLAGLLIEKGFEPDTIVALMVHSSVDMIIALLGILKAGGAYLPVDPEYPLERMHYMLADSEAQLLLTTRRVSEEVEKLRSLEVEKVFIEEGRGEAFPFFSSSECFAPTCVRPSNKSGVGARRAVPSEPATCNLKPVTNPLHLAYVIYTSGSTGRPKGVMVRHRGVVRLVKNPDFIDFREGERLLMTGSLTFDISTLEIWGALLNGLLLFVVSKEILMDGEKLGGAVVGNKITILHLIPQLFNQLIERWPLMFAGLEYFLVGGDLVRPGPVNKLRKIYDHIKIIHAYGPTENTVFSTTLKVDKDYGERLPIGRPTANSSVYIVGKYGELQPIGKAGELVTGGDGVARGYLNKPELTAERFFTAQAASFEPQAQAFIIQPPQADHMSNKSYTSYLYKTGDLARWLPDGNIEFLGRADYQVKVRGIRIELGEIENLLAGHEKIKEAVVIDREEKNGDKYLCAYLVAATPKAGTGGEVRSEGSIPDDRCDSRPPDRNELRTYLSGILPAYMVPSYFIFLNQVPLNPNGKVDRKALPVPEFETDEGSISPRNELEEKLVKIWAEILDIDEGVIGIDTDFFEVGGHSMKASILVARLNKELRVKLKLADIFLMTTIRSLSSHIGSEKAAAPGEVFSLPKAVEKEFYELSSAQQRLFILQQRDKNNMTYNMPRIMFLKGKVDEERLAKTFYRLIARHESFRTSFKMVAGKPMQKIHKPEEVSFKIRHFDSQGDGDELKGIIERFIRPFALDRAPLLRVGLKKQEKETYILMVDMHHIISDGTSVGVFIRDFMAIFAEQESLLPELTHTYKDFSGWQNSPAGQETIKKQEQFWLAQFAGEVPDLELPADFPRGQFSLAGDSIKFEIGIKKVKALNRLAKEESVTLFMVLFTVYNVLLSKLSWSEDITVGTPVMGRNFAELQPIVGMFVNTLALRNYPAAGKSFKEFLQELKECTLACFENQDYPFEYLVEKVVPAREAWQNPLFDTMFTLQNIDIPEAQIPGLKLKQYDYRHRYARFDMTWIGSERDGSLNFIVEYSTALFKAERIGDFAQYFKEIIDLVIGNREILLGDIEISPDLVDSERSVKKEAMGNFDF